MQKLAEVRLDFSWQFCNGSTQSNASDIKLKSSSYNILLILTTNRLNFVLGHIWFDFGINLFVALGTYCYIAAGCDQNDWKNPYSPPVFSCLQFLLDVLQGQVPLWGAGDAVGDVRHRGGRLQDDLKRLT